MIPQFTVWRDLDLENISMHRGAASWTTIFARALALAIRDNLPLNSVWENGDLRSQSEVRLSLAVTTPLGLLMPTITDPDISPVDDTDATIRRVIDRARLGKVDAPNLVPGTITLSNLGGLGVDRFNALLTPPQVAALSLGAIRSRVVSDRGGIMVRLQTTAGLTVDHRAADGADGARLLDSLQSVLNAPRRLVSLVPRL